MKKKGIILGTRKRNGRTVFIYMYDDLFAEVLYKEDNPENDPEHFTLVSGLDRLNEHLEREA